MTLTPKLGAVFDCGYDSDGMPDAKKLKAAGKELVKIIKNSGLFPKEGMLLDIGSGMYGSDLVNRYSKEFPDITTIYLDSAIFLLEKLNKGNKICADAVKMPFQDETFGIEYAGGIISNGVLKNCEFFNNQSYLLAKEAHRTLKPGGSFLFTYIIGDDSQTILNLLEIGFKKLVHLQRVIWGPLPTDVYAVRK